MRSICVDSLTSRKHNALMFRSRVSLGRSLTGRGKMSKTRSLVFAVTAGVALAVLAIPAMAQPRHQHGAAGWETLPAPVGLAAEPWQTGGPGFVQKTPWEVVQQPSPEILPPPPDAAAQKMFMPSVQKGDIPCGPNCGCPPQRRIEYRNHCRPLRKGDCLCAPPIQTVLAVPDGSLLPGCG